MPNTATGAEQWTVLGQATVTSGGTDSPSAGTQESWTLSNSTLPAASSSATPPTYFYGGDEAKPGEVFLFTNISGSSATVTRGADGSTPTTHASQFTVVQVASGASWRTLQQPWVVFPSGDSTGGTDPVHVQNAIDGYNHATLVGGFGSYYGTITVNCVENQFVECAGFPSWTIAGTGVTAFNWTSASQNTYQVEGNGGIRGHLEIIGHSASANPADGTVAVEMGDIVQLESDILAVNCQYGLLLNNRAFWAEQGNHYVRSQGCTNPVVMQTASSGGTQRTGSFDRTRLTVYHNDFNYAGWGNGGVQMLAGAQMAGGSLRQYGNFSGTGSPGFYALYVNGTAPAGPTGVSSMIGCEIIHGLEWGGSGTAFISPMYIGTGCYVTQCSGNLWYYSFSASELLGDWSFDGPIYGDDTLITNQYGQITALPSRWGGVISYRQTGNLTTASVEATGDLVYLDLALNVEASTSITANEVIATLPSGWSYPSDNKYITIWYFPYGENATAIPININPAGSIVFNGVAGTSPSGGTSYLYGSGVYSAQA